MGSLKVLKHRLYLFYFDPVRFFRSNLSFFWNKPSSLRFDLFKFMNKKSLIRIDLSFVWNKQSSLRFDHISRGRFASLRSF